MTVSDTHYFVETTPYFPGNNIPQPYSSTEVTLSSEYSKSTLSADVDGLIDEVDYTTIPWMFGRVHVNPNDYLALWPIPLPHFDVISIHGTIGPGNTLPDWPVKVDGNGNPFLGGLSAYTYEPITFAQFGGLAKLVGYFQYSGQYCLHKGYINHLTGAQAGPEICTPGTSNWGNTILVVNPVVEPLEDGYIRFTPNCTCP